MKIIKIVVTIIIGLTILFTYYNKVLSKKNIIQIAENNNLVIPKTANVEIVFAPSQRALESILDFINEAETSIYICAYSFTNKQIAQALVRQKKRGIDVKAVMDYKDNQKKYSVAQFLANSGVDTRLNDNYKILHHKFIIVDNKSIELGSFNYSVSAYKRNAENIFILRNSPEIVAVYYKEWQRLFDEAVVLKGNY